MKKFSTSWPPELIFLKNVEEENNKKNIEIATLTSPKIDIYLNTESSNNDLKTSMRNKNKITSRSASKAKDKTDIYNKNKINKIVVDINNSFKIKSRFDCSQEKISKFQKNPIYFPSLNHKNSNHNINKVSYSVNKKKGNPIVDKTNLKKNNRNSNRNTTDGFPIETMTTTRKNHPLFKLNLEVNPGKYELIVFYPHHQVDTIAYDLALKYNLENEK